MIERKGWFAAAGGLLLLSLSAPAGAEGTRDPFRPFINPAVVDPCGAETMDPRPGIRSLKLVAVLSEAGRRHAVLEDAARHGTVVTAGTSIAARETVARIDSDAIAVEERIDDRRGATRITHERQLDPQARKPICRN